MHYSSSASGILAENLVAAQGRDVINCPVIVVIIIQGIDGKPQHTTRLNGKDIPDAVLLSVEATSRAVVFTIAGRIKNLIRIITRTVIAVLLHVNILANRDGAKTVLDGRRLCMTEVRCKIPNAGLKMRRANINSLYIKIFITEWLRKDARPKIQKQVMIS